MKRIFIFAALGMVLGFATAALGAGEDRQCSVTFTNAAAGTTATPTSGTCSWNYGATVLLQCDQDVYFSQTGTATSNDFKIAFTSNSDPYIVYLSPNQKTITFLGVSASGTCKLGASSVRKTTK